MNRQEMIQRLIKVQNHPLFQNQDILTITGFMNDDQVRRHVVDCINATYKYDEKAA